MLKITLPDGMPAPFFVVEVDDADVNVSEIVASFWNLANAELFVKAKAWEQHWLSKGMTKDQLRIAETTPESARNTWDQLQKAVEDAKLADAIPEYVPVPDSKIT